jgi:hypothetical protein
MIKLPITYGKDISALLIILIFVLLLYGCQTKERKEEALS